MGLFGGIGKIFNDITGVSNSAKINNQYQKEFAQNAHQWEMQDLQKAGLNPALTASGGSGASASGGGSAGSAGINPLAAISELGNLANNTRATDANTKLTYEQAGAIKQQLANDATNAKANLISATAAAKNVGLNSRGTIEQFLGENSTNSIKNWTVEKRKNLENFYKSKEYKKYSSAKNSKQAWKNIMGN